MASASPPIAAKANVNNQCAVISGEILCATHHQLLFLVLLLQLSPRFCVHVGWW